MISCLRWIPHNKSMKKTQMFIRKIILKSITFLNFNNSPNVILNEI